jgi:hypothetical protein
MHFDGTDNLCIGRWPLFSGTSLSMNVDPPNSHTRRPRPADFPALASLQLTSADLVTLASQGFVASERRGERRYHKLRFRRGRRQVVKYLGGPERACAVQAELDRLQAAWRRRRKLGALSRQAREMLREAKRQLEPSLAEQGYHFHGLAIRESRR